MSELESETERVFEALNGRKFRFIKMYSPNIVMVWEILKKDHDGWNREKLVGIDVHKINIDVLKSLKIWDDLSEEVKNRVVNGVNSVDSVNNVIVNKESNVINKEDSIMARTSKHVGVPNQVTCIKCGGKTAIAPSILAVRIEKSGKSIEDFVSNWACAKCVPPVRGRKPNPELANYPKQMTCSCGNKVNTNISYLKIKADKKGVTVKSLIDSFKCQTCEPTKGRHKFEKHLEAPEVVADRA
jgi:hypothetical protein